MSLRFSKFFQKNGKNGLKLLKLCVKFDSLQLSRPRCKQNSGRRTESISISKLNLKSLHHFCGIRTDRRKAQTVIFLLDTPKTTLLLTTLAAAATSLYFFHCHHFTHQHEMNEPRMKTSQNKRTPTKQLLFTISCHSQPSLPRTIRL